MAVVRVQIKSLGGNGTSLILTLDNTPQSGAKFVAAIATEGPNITSMVQTGAAWFQTAKQSGPPTEVQLFTTGVTSGAGTQITVNLASSSSLAVVIAEYVGVQVTNDVNSSLSGTGSPTRSGTAGTTAQARELWVGALSGRHASAVFSNPRDGFVIVDQISGTGPAADGQRVALLENIVDGIGDPEAIADIAGPTLEWAAAFRAFFAAAQTPQDPAGPSTPQPTVPEALAKQDDHIGTGLLNLVQQFRSVT